MQRSTYKWLLFLLPATIVAAQPPSPASSYVGSAQCRTCHPDLWMPFYKNPHFRSVASGKEAPENIGCEGCHGPGGAHIRQQGAMTDFRKISPAVASRVCLRCHAEAISRANIRTSPHNVNGVGCTTCHSVHHSPAPRFLLAAPEATLCYRCHEDVRAQFDMPFKHRVNEGVMNCSDCHNPHGTYPPTWRSPNRREMVTTVLANEEPCLKCHADKRGPFAYEHPPVRVEGCEMCHSPHGSADSRLLRRPVVFTLCLECHNGAPSFGLQRQGEPMPSQAHNMADPRYRNCTACHVRIHGSNSSSLFLR
jgi:DmsE family decaheme c-type cytochrome